jgi:Mn-containing catalase
VRVDNPNPAFAKYLQQAIGGVEGEMRVMNQYFFQGANVRGEAAKYKDMLMNTATEEIGIKLAGQDPRQYLSAALGAMPADANGVPFDASHVYASGHIVADMHSNIAAEATGRLLATRLWHMTDDAGMKDMLSFLIARDTMHQNQWLAVLEEIEEPYPVPSSFLTAARTSDSATRSWSTATSVAPGSTPVRPPGANRRASSAARESSDVPIPSNLAMRVGVSSCG